MVIASLANLDPDPILRAFPIFLGVNTLRASGNIIRSILGFSKDLDASINNAIARLM
jgi:hypothetical protein